MGLAVPQVVTVSDVYTKDHPIPAELGGSVSATFHQPRTTDASTADLALAARGFVDMGIELSHNLTAGVEPVKLRVTIRAHLLGMGGLGTLLGHQFATEFVPSGGIWFLQSEKGSVASQFEDATHHVADLPELRLPYRFLRLSCSPLLVDGVTTVAPDAGEIAVAITRRS